MPERVRVGLPLPPALMAAPFKLPMVTLPLPTVRRVVARLPSTSFTLKPVMLIGASSLTVCAAGMVLTGASFTVFTVMLVLPATVTVPSNTL